MFTTYISIFQIVLVIFKSILNFKVIKFLVGSIFVLKINYFTCTTSALMIAYHYSCYNKMDIGQEKTTFTFPHVLFLLWRFHSVLQCMGHLSMIYVVYLLRNGMDNSKGICGWFNILWQQIWCMLQILRRC